MAGPSRDILRPQQGRPARPFIWIYGHHWLGGVGPISIVVIKLLARMVRAVYIYLYVYLLGFYPVRPNVQHTTFSKSNISKLNLNSEK